MRTYGITMQDFEKMYKKQNGRCAICRGRLDLERRSPHVDHNHKTGAIRGLLCGRCNTGLGLFKDSIRRLAQAIVYLEENGSTFSDNFD